MKESFLKFGIIAAALGSVARMSNGIAEAPNTTRKRPISNRRKLSRERNQREINLSRGLKEFVYEFGSVWAINQKNADRKARKLELGGRL